MIDKEIIERITMNYRGRFAPSPSGHLHMGSLLAAVASYADARHHSGTWKLRIDNIDLARVAKGSELSIIKTLESLGFEWDGPIRYQNNNKQYQEALEYLFEQEKAYNCSCSRREIYQNNDGIYPGTCRNKSLAETCNDKLSVRIVSQNEISQFIDQVQGKQVLEIKKQEDFIIKRSDNIMSYHLSTIIDDYLDNISHVVRGYDLVDSSLKQVLLLNNLHLPIPSYAHIPLLVNQNGIKLSKRSGAKAVKSSIKALFQAAHYLGQELDKALLRGSVEDFWNELILNWDMSQVPKHANIEQ